MVWAIAHFYDKQTNMVAEARALLQGISKCWIDGDVQVDVDTDSMILIQILQGKVDIPWILAYEIRETKQILSKMDGGLMHA